MDPLDRLWRSIAGVLAEIDPENDGVRSPGTKDALRRQRVPEAWHRLWLWSDGQPDTISGVFGGWTFLPLEGPVDSVEADRLSIPGAPVPLAKDFGGNYLVIEEDGSVVEQDTDLETRTVIAQDLQGFLEWVLQRYAKGEVPEQLVVGEDGRPRPARWRDVVVDLGALGVGDTAPLEDTPWVVVRMRADAVPGRLLPDPQRELPYAIDSLDDDGPVPRIVDVSLEPRLPGHGWSSRGAIRWITAEHALAQPLRVRLTLDPEAESTTVRPLRDIRAAEASTDRDQRWAGALAAWWLGRNRVARRLLEGETRSEATELTALLDLAAGKPQDAIETLAKTPAHPVAIRALVAAERFPDALSRATELLESPDVDEAEALELRAWVRLESGDVAGARADLHEALEASGVRISGGRLWAKLEELGVGSSGGPNDPAELTDEAHLLEDRYEWKGEDELVVTLTPSEAEQGLVIVLDDSSAVRLPAGAGHGSRLTVQLVKGPATVEARIELPAGHVKVEGATVQKVDLERWDIHLHLPARATTVRVHVGPRSGEAQFDGSSGRITGLGLGRPGGGRGDVVLFGV